MLQTSPAPANYILFRYIDQGGVRDQATGERLEAFRLLIPKGWKFQRGIALTAQSGPAVLGVEEHRAL